MPTVCPNCGSDQEDDSVFCEECGFQINSENPSKTPSRESVQESNSPVKKKIKFINKKR